MEIYYNKSTVCFIIITEFQVDKGIRISIFWSYIKKQRFSTEKYKNSFVEMIKNCEKKNTSERGAHCVLQ